MKLPWPIWAILACFVGMTLAYSSNTPYRQSGHLLFSRNPDTGLPQQAPDVGAPDERQHANYVSHILAGKGFPVLIPGSADIEETYQSHQPPLFYLVAAGWSKAVAADPAQADAGVKLRFINTIIGLFTIVGVYWLIVWGLGREDAALAGAAFVAFLPMNVALHSAVSNDPLLYCLVTWAVALAVKGLQQGWVYRDAAFVGLITGLAILTKTTALALLPTLLTVMMVSWKSHDPSRRPTLQVWALVLVLPMLVAAPWLIRNMGVYGDPFALKAFNEAFVNSPQAAQFIGDLGLGTYLTQWVAWWTARSFVGVFGYMDVFFFESLGAEKSGSLYTAIIFLLVLPLALGPLLFKQNRQVADEESLPEPWRFQAVVGTLALVVTLLFIRFNMTYFQGQARYLFPAIGAFAAWYGLGLSNLLRPRGWERHAWIVASLFLIALDIVGLMTIQQGFPRRI